MTCANCGAELLPGAMFCGECGYSVAPRRIPASGSLAPEPPVVGKVPPQRPIPPVRSVQPAVPAEPASPLADPDSPLAEPVEAPAPHPSAMGETSVLPIEPLVSVPPPPPPPPAPPVPTAAGIPPIPPAPASLPAATQPRGDIPVFHAPAPVPPPTRTTEPERFVLQFSTGESVTVTGTGIIGRNPSAEPGEYVDHLVTVVDYDKSVSKSHLDFGQDNGRFWVSDRFSANGTTVREPDRAPRRCDPGIRVHVSRGSRVDMGEQFFIVS